jgi:hypothetical protein
MAALIQLGPFISVPDGALTSFLSVRGRRLAANFAALLIRAHRVAPLYRPFPNTDPGLAGETGTSGVAGTV